MGDLTPLWMLVVIAAGSWAAWVSYLIRDRKHHS